MLAIYTLVYYLAHCHHMTSTVYGTLAMLELALCARMQLVVLDLNGNNKCWFMQAYCIH